MQTLNHFVMLSLPKDMFYLWIQQDRSVLCTANTRRQRWLKTSQPWRHNSLCGRGTTQPPWKQEISIPWQWQEALSKGWQTAVPRLMRRLVQEAEAWSRGWLWVRVSPPHLTPSFLLIMCPQCRQRPKAEVGRAEVMSTAPSCGCPPILPCCNTSFATRFCCSSHRQGNE